MNGLLSLKDSLYAISDFYFNQSIRGKNITIEEMVEKLTEITKEDIMKVAGKLQPDMVYFLRNN